MHDVRARICHSPERQQRCLAEEAETASQLQEEHCHLQTRVEELRRKMQKAPREREALTKLKTQLHSSLAVAQRLESLVQDKDNASAHRSVPYSVFFYSPPSHRTWCPKTAVATWAVVLRRVCCDL